MTSKLSIHNRAITAVCGVEAGHWTSDDGATGTTVILFPKGARAGHVVPGPAAGTRDFAALDPAHPAEVIHGICLSGGSSFGLAAVDGVLGVLCERNIGFDTGFGYVPVVPGAILFDLDSGGVRPSTDSGRAAAQAATDSPLTEGRIGVGAGAYTARMFQPPSPSGVGGWADRCGQWIVSVFVGVNALGAVRDPSSGEWLAGGPTPPKLTNVSSGFGHNTTLAIVCTDAPLTRTQAVSLARMASAGIARTIYPAFTPFDGDVVIAASTALNGVVGLAVLCRLGHLAAGCLSQAIIRAVHDAPNS